ncbi:MAG TPA: hypothetical protein VJJ22_03845 [Candidatus Paceibacterota bacterium]
MRQDLTVVQKNHLALTEPSVLAVAKRFGWKPETLLARLEKALPAVIEQTLFITLTSHMDAGITPEKFAELLRMLSSMPIRIDDLRKVAVGPNMAISKIDHIGDYLQAALELLGKLTGDTNVNLTVNQAGRLALAFGDSAFELIDQISEHQQEIAEYLNYNKDNYTFAILAYDAVERLLQHVESGRTHPINIMEIFGYTTEALREGDDDKEGS